MYSFNLSLKTVYIMLLSITLMHISRCNLNLKWRNSIPLHNIHKAVFQDEEYKYRRAINDLSYTFSPLQKFPSWIEKEIKTPYKYVMANSNTEGTDVDLPLKRYHYD